MRLRSTKAILPVLTGLVVTGLALAWPAAALAQAPTTTQLANDEAAKNAAQARAALDAMVQAMGGQAWLDIKNKEIEGHVAAFYQGNPDVGTTQTYEYHQWPDHDRIDVTKHRDVVEFYIGREGWEVTYRGKKAMDSDQTGKEALDDYLRRRDHSIETVVKEWLKDPNTILIYEGPHGGTARRRAGDGNFAPERGGNHHDGRGNASAATARVPVARSAVSRQEHRRRGV